VVVGEEYSSFFGSGESKKGVVGGGEGDAVVAGDGDALKSEVNRSC
jgi:hypothetical protein